MQIDNSYKCLRNLLPIPNPSFIFDWIIGFVTTKLKIYAKGFANLKGGQKDGEVLGTSKYVFSIYFKKVEFFMIYKRPNILPKESHHKNTSNLIQLPYRIETRSEQDEVNFTKIVATSSIYLLLFYSHILW